jgi:large repetitive protein
VTLSDDGGGADTSPAQTFTISVQGNAVDDAYTVDAATGPVGLAVMANDSPPPSGWVVSTLTVSSSAGKGSTSVDPTTGVITYTPNVGATGTDTFRYQWQDGDSPPSSYEATVTITFSPPPV